MDWIHTKRRGPQWKQGWTEQTFSSISAPPLPLIAVFAIVIFLLSISSYSSYKEQMSSTLINFKILLFLASLLLVFFVRSSLFDFWTSSQNGQRQVRWQWAHVVAGFPWGVAALVVVLLVLVSYQSTFHSKWFPFGSSD
ncbi:hypothetical protein ABFS82_14G117900 [Erythranthe guttata]|uniref:Transmembrane protein n=1 Tax=Erythranthe guttata TaxID=4155 RepID=A0A022RIZ4_ERYGU|nr:PREDICTED: uncharacterized protein LOC105954583 [Erythranthe guttata]EYU40402.1 hypothetical protein MIMGU_mgv1a019965mg [Erythranthe guttata]|eukprot:XP_012833701.1 PREDICTED: uncharacterized protein LOC105954583 [Erythranthe guttata]